MSAETVPATVVNVQPAPNYVTREVFDATIKPITDNVSEIKTDVKVLLARDAGSRAISGLFTHFSTIFTTLIAGGVGAALTIFFH